MRRREVPSHVYVVFDGEGNILYSSSDEQEAYEFRGDTLRKLK